MPESEGRVDALAPGDKPARINSQSQAMHLASHVSMGGGQARRIEPGQGKPCPYRDRAGWWDQRRHAGLPLQVWDREEEVGALREPRLPRTRMKRPRRAVPFRGST